MLDVAQERGVEGDVCLHDLGQGLPLRPGTFDGAISISAVQWLCNAVRAALPRGSSSTITPFDNHCRLDSRPARTQSWRDGLSFKSPVRLLTPAQCMPLAMMAWYLSPHVSAAIRFASWITAM